jgi:hypothetical protein
MDGHSVHVSAVTRDKHGLPSNGLNFLVIRELSRAQTRRVDQNGSTGKALQFIQARNPSLDKFDALLLQQSR